MKWYEKSDSGWYYVTTKTLGYHVPELKLPDCTIKSLKGRTLGFIKGGWLILEPGYAWDGCSVVGRLVETDRTLHASCLHDFLYQLAEQGDTFVVPYTQKLADQAFKRYLPCWAKLVWYTGVRVFGGLYYGDATPSLIIELDK